MFSINIHLQGLASLMSAAVLTWAWSLYKKNVAIVDSLWPLMFILTAFVYAAAAPWPLRPRAQLVLVLTVAWGMRLSIHITRRNWGQGEDPRYRAIRARNQPHFDLKSLYLVFALQALLAWIISLPLLGSILGDGPLGAVDAVGALLWILGLIFEAGGDWQLARFMADPANKGCVMDRGLWRYTRHPNYFGDFCVWWGFYLIAVAAGAWWSIVSPLIMSLLLLRVSGVTLLESSIAQRRPGYADYVRRTSVFWPWFPKVT